MHQPVENKHICASFVPIFSSLPVSELQKINALIRKKEYKKGETLFYKGDIANHLFIVRYGKVKLFEMFQEGRQQTIRILIPGDIFGELVLFSNHQPYTLNAEALLDCGICLISRDDFNQLIINNPEISLDIMKTLAHRLALAEHSMGDLTLKNIDQRVAAWLMELLEREGIKTQEGYSITITLPRHEIANIVGTTRETLSRKLTRMQEDGIIKVNGHRNIVIVDKEQLAALALN
jgi:CRP/FNR family transcriptional regulator, anaerobic regulatory protein